MRGTFDAFGNRALSPPERSLPDATGPREGGGIWHARKQVRRDRNAARGGATQRRGQTAAAHFAAVWCEMRRSTAASRPPTGDRQGGTPIADGPIFLGLIDRNASQKKTAVTIGTPCATSLPRDGTSPAHTTTFPRWGL